MHLRGCSENLVLRLPSLCFRDSALLFVDFLAGLDSWLGYAAPLAVEVVLLLLLVDGHPVVGALVEILDCDPFGLEIFFRWVLTLFVLFLGVSDVALEELLAEAVGVVRA